MIPGEMPIPGVEELLQAAPGSSMRERRLSGWSEYVAVSVTRLQSGLVAARLMAMQPGQRRAHVDLLDEYLEPLEGAPCTHEVLGYWARCVERNHGGW